MSEHNPAKMNSENRRLRNRLSQQAFRARQAMRIKELEERLDQQPKSDAAQTAQLQDINAALRKQLLDCHKRVCSLQISMKTLAASTALAIGLDHSEDTTSSNRLCSRCRQSDEEDCHQINTHIQTSQMSDNNCNMDNSLAPMHGRSLSDQRSHAQSVALLENRRTFSGNGQGPPQPPAINLDRLEFGPSSDTFSPMSPSHSRPATESHSGGIFAPLQFPISPSFTYMGFEQYEDILDRSPLIAPNSQMPLRRTNSLFSDHISVIEYLVQQRWLKQSPGVFNQDQFTESIQFMIAVFVLVSWQIMTAWHTYTKADIPLKELSAWRVTRTPEAYAKIIPSYRPTKLQMTTPHPAIIDWIPWSSLRDKLIIYHSANPCLDSLICDVGNCYVVPADLSKLVAGLPAMIGYLSVWDLVRAIAPDSTSLATDSSPTPGSFARDADAIRSIFCEDDEGAVEDEVYFGSKSTLPAPDAQTLFSTRHLAIQAFKALGMDRGAATFRLDPGFFDRHPELYDPQCDLIARGMALRSSSQWSMPTPIELNASVVAQYKESARWNFDRTSADRVMSPLG